ncbi:TetR/AcrR family transcriptional regulator [Roseateles sp. GG27B]
MKKEPDITEDHRVRVGAQRREKTRLRLLQSALEVFSDKGPDGAVIDDVIAAAGVSRGTFYNHFRTTSELLLALATAMSDEVLTVVDPVVLTFDDPVHRFSAGTRMYMHMALRYPTWGRFITNVGTRIGARGQLIDQHLTRDLTVALDLKRVVVTDLLVARDIVLGSIFYGIETMLTEPTHEHHAEQLVATFLRGMGVAAAEADAIAFMPLPDVGIVRGPIFATVTPVPKSARKAAPKATPKVAPKAPRAAKKSGVA